MLDPRNLIDVLTAAGAARASGGKFSPARDAQIMPEITSEQAERLIDELRAVDFSTLHAAIPPLAVRMGHMDMLRGAGQMPTLDVRARRIVERVTAADIVRWRDSEASRVPNLSLRWEIGHESDRPAAQRWAGSKPHPRLSHLGRNALALAVVALDAVVFLVPPYGTPWHRMDEWAYMGLPRCWFVPYTPTSYPAWKALQMAGPPVDPAVVVYGSDYRSGSPTPAVMADGEWHFARIAAAGKTLHLAPAEAPAAVAK